VDVLVLEKNNVPTIENVREEKIFFLPLHEIFRNSCFLCRKSY